MAEAGVPPDKLRVLCIHTATLPPLGADTWVHAQIIRSLDRSAHEIHVACRLHAGGTPTPTGEAIRDIAGIDVVPVDLGPEIRERTLAGKLLGLLATLPAVIGVVRMVLLVRRRRIQVIHTSDRPRDAFVAVIIGRFTGAVSLVHVHVTYNPRWMGWMLRWSLDHADALVAVSSFVGDSLVSGGQAPERVHVVLNGIEIDAWQPGVGREATRRELQIAEDAPVVVVVCRLFPEKGPADLIRAIAAVRQEFADVVLLVVGLPLEPGYGDELVALARELGVQDHVRFLGRRPDVPVIMSAADVFAMPSHEEPFGLVFVEAMAMCLPVVALADGGTLEIVEHGRTGLLSTWGDGAQLASDLRTLFRDRSLRDSMGSAGRRRAAARFTVERMASDVARVYRLIAC